MPARRSRSRLRGEALARTSGAGSTHVTIRGLPSRAQRVKEGRPSRRTPASTGTPTTAPRQLAWAALLQRVFEVDALRCPGCEARMRLLAAIEDPEVARKILECLDLPARAPPLQPASSTVALWPETDFADQEQSWEFDQTPRNEDGTE